MDVSGIPHRRPHRALHGPLSGASHRRVAHRAVRACGQVCDASRAGRDPIDPGFAPMTGREVLQQDPLTMHPHPVTPRPSPVAANVHMTGRRGDHDLFDERRRHRSDRNLNIVPVFPAPAVLSPYVVPRHPLVPRSRWRRGLLDHRWRRLSVDDPRRRCWLANNRGASRTETSADDGCTHRESTNHVALSPLDARHRRAWLLQRC